jgi:hypothetical protein
MKKYLGDFNSLTKEFKPTPLPLESFRECLVHGQLNPIRDEQGHETPEYQSAVKAAASLSLGKALKFFGEDRANTSPCNASVDVADPNRYAGDSLSVQATAYAEYLCGDSKAKPKDRAEKAKDETIKLYSKLYAYRYRQNGAVSEEQFLVDAKFSENTEERFADAMGDTVFAQMVKDKYPDDTPNFLENRRKLVAANQIMLCSKGAGVTEALHGDGNTSDDAHPSDAQRILDFMSPGMREVLRCKKDFDNKECPLQTYN